MKKLFLLISPLFVYGTLVFGNEDGACKDEAHLYCPQKTYGEGDVFRCLLNSRKAISPKCQKHIDEMVETRESCQADIDNQCSYAKKGHGQIRGCLMAKQSHLSPACRKDLGI